MLMNRGRFACGLLLLAAWLGSLGEAVHGQIFRPSPQPAPPFPRARPFPLAATQGAIARIDGEKVILLTDDGRETAFIVDARTRFVLDDREAALADFPVGTPVAIFIDPRDRGRFATFVRNLPQPMPAPAQAPADTDTATRFAAYGAGPNLERADAPQATPTADFTARGRILEVQDQTVRFKALDGAEMTFTIDSNTQVDVGDRSAKAGDLKAGQQAVIAASTLEGGNRLLSVNVTGEEASAREKANRPEAPRPNP
jgi:hypothetical protein